MRKHIKSILGDFTKVSIHQPMYIPWLGLFDRINQCDTFVLLDNVPYSKNYYINRNRIKTQNGPIWLTVPVLSAGLLGQQIKDVKIDNSTNWAKQHWKSIYFSYSKAEYFSEYSGFFEQLYGKEHKNLDELIDSAFFFCIKSLGIKTKIIKASELNAVGKKEELVLNICKLLHADEYLSGPSGRDYLDARNWEKEGIRLGFHDYVHPMYKQLYGEFAQNMSVIDLLFNCGSESLKILSKKYSGNRKTISGLEDA